MIPFIGAATSSDDIRKSLYEKTFDKDGNEIHPSAYRDALIALSGIATGVGVTVCGPFFYGMLSGAQIGFALADFGFMVNLLSLAPLGSLPGGTITGAVNKWFLPAGLIALSSLLYLVPGVSPILYLVWLMGAYRTYQLFFPGELEIWRRANGYYDTTDRQKLYLSVGYVAMLSVAIGGSWLNAKYKKDPRVLKREMAVEAARQELLGRGGATGDDGDADVFPPSGALGGISQWALNSLDDFDESELLGCDSSELLRG